MRQTDGRVSLRRQNSGGVSVHGRLLQDSISLPKFLHGATTCTGPEWRSIPTIEESLDLSHVRDEFIQGIVLPEQRYDLSDHDANIVTPSPGQ